MNDHSEIYYLALIYDFLTGNLDKDQLQELQDWRQESAEHQHFYEQACLFFEMMDFGITSDDYDLERAFQEFLSRQAEEHQAPSPKNYTRIWSYAAVAAALILTFFIGIYYSKETARHENRSTAIFVEKGSKSRTILPDGTAVWLNSASKLELNPSFGEKERRIKVEGEAFFDVAHDKGRPFIVETADVQVRVLGTAFNLSCYPKENTRVALVRGLVELVSNQGQAVRMHPNETVVYHAESTSFHRVSSTIEDEYGWRESKFIFKDRSFHLIVSQLERMFAIDIEVLDKELLQRKFTGDFVSNESLSEILNVMSKGGEFNYHIKGRKVKIY